MDGDGILLGMNVVELVVEARIEGRLIRCRELVATQLWEDPEARHQVERSLRMKLASEILEHWKPVVKVRR